MKKNLTLLSLLFLGAVSLASAQPVGTVNFRQSQSRISEPNMEVFVRPLVVDLNIISEQKVVDVWTFPAVNLLKLSDVQIQNLKATALFNSSQKHNADVIVAAVFDIQSIENNKGFGINITVAGYPAKYSNWKPATESADYEWIKDVYGTAIGRNRVDATSALKK